LDSVIGIKFIGRNVLFIGRDVLFIGRVEMFIGRNELFIGRNVSLIGQTTDSDTIPPPRNQKARPLLVACFSTFDKNRGVPVTHNQTFFK
jgi:hypothetical protein